jgi:hypothetical protein
MGHNRCIETGQAVKFLFFDLVPELLIINKIFTWAKIGECLSFDNAIQQRHFYIFLLLKCRRILFQHRKQLFAKRFISLIINDANTIFLISFILLATKRSRTELDVFSSPQDSDFVMEKSKSGFNSFVCLTISVPF